MHPFKHKTAIQLRFKDGDVMGHVNNANHFTYFELARINYFKEVLAQDVNWNRSGIILAHIAIDYKQPLLITDEVFAYTRCSRLGTKSFDLEYLLTAKTNDEEKTIATSISTLVCFNYEINASISLPDEWRNKISLFEGL